MSNKIGVMQILTLVIIGIIFISSQSIQSFAAPQVTVGTPVQLPEMYPQSSCYSKCTHNLWKFTINGTGFIDNIETRIGISSDVYGFEGITVFTDENGSFSTTAISNKALHESGNWIVVVSNGGQRYEFPIQLKFKEYPDNTITWKIKQLDYIDGYAQLDITGNINLDSSSFSYSRTPGTNLAQSLFDYDRLIVQFQTSSDGRWTSNNDSFPLSSGNFFHHIKKIDYTPGEIPVRFLFDGLVRYGSITLSPEREPETVPEPKPEISVV